LLVEAERSCDLAIAADPECRDAHVERARTLFAAERYEDAVESGRRALALAHFDPQTHLLLGTALAALGRPHDAVAQLLIAVEQDPGLVAAYRRLAAVHVRQLGDVTAARAYAARAAEARAATVRKGSAE
jgi:tetratricopeptide (TPR) repeat protein